MADYFSRYCFGGRRQKHRKRIVGRKVPVLKSAAINESLQEYCSSPRVEECDGKDDDGRLIEEVLSAGASTEDEIVQTFTWSCNAQGLLQSAASDAGTYTFQYDDLADWSMSKSPSMGG